MKKKKGRKKVAARCWCPKCKGGVPVSGVVKRAERWERLRGFEFEFDSEKQMEVVSARGACKEHLTFCDGRCKRNVGAGEVWECDCELCVEKKTKVVKAPECDGHGCVEKVPLDRWFEGVIKNGAAETQVPVVGELNQYGHAPKSAFMWHLKSDRSCGFEIASPPCDGERMAIMVRPLMEKIAEEEKKHKGSFVTSRCGLHCTIGVEDFNQANLGRLIYFVSTHQDAFLQTQAVERANNPTCAKIQKFGAKDKRKLETNVMELADDLVSAEGGNRYRVANFTRAIKDKVVEFRFGSMTTDWKKIVAYGTMVECIVQAALDGRTSTKGTALERFYDCVFAPYAGSERVKMAWDIIKEGARGK